MPARILIVAPTGVGGVIANIPFPTGPQHDGTLLVNLDTGFWMFWNAPTSQWVTFLK